MGVYSDVYKWQQMPQREPDPKTICNFCKQITSEGKWLNECSKRGATAVA